MVWPPTRFSLFQFCSSSNNGSSCCCFCTKIQHSEYKKLTKQKLLMTGHKNPLWAITKSKYLLWAVTRFLVTAHKVVTSPISFQKHISSQTTAILYSKNPLHSIEKKDEKNPMWAVTTHDPSQHTICICLYQPYGVIMYRYV